MATILLIETATEVCSVGLSVDGCVRAVAEEPPPARHAAQLTLLIQDCLQQAGSTLAELDAVAVSSGPGSYTGLRVGASVAKGICYALSKPLIAVNTLDALAAGMRSAQADSGEDVLFMPMLDARRQEVWTAVCDHRLRRLTPPEVLILENNLFSFLEKKTGISAGVKRLILGGNGSVKVEKGVNLSGPVIFSVLQCAAAFLSGEAEGKFKESDFEDVVYFEPVYMKPPNITAPKKI